MATPKTAAECFDAGKNRYVWKKVFDFCGFKNDCTTIKPKKWVETVDTLEGRINYATPDNALAWCRWKLYHNEQEGAFKAKFTEPCAPKQRDQKQQLLKLQAAILARHPRLGAGLLRPHQRINQYNFDLCFQFIMPVVP